MLGVRWSTVTIDRLQKAPGLFKSLIQSYRHRRERAAARPIRVESGFDIVIVVFSDDLPAFRLLARSLARFLSDSFDGRILIVVNDLDVAGVTSKIQRMAPDFGRWRDKVETIPFFAIGSGLNPYNGWIFQQALKLGASQIVDRPFYLLFDAKNHAIRPIDATLLLTEDGRARQNFAERPASMPDHYRTCARYLDLDEASAPPVCRPMTPFMMHTQTARDLIAFVEQKEGRNFFSFFRSARLISEFMLYGLFAKATKAAQFPEHYLQSDDIAIVAWSAEQIEGAVEMARAAQEIHVFGVHRDALTRSDPAGASILEGFWREIGLLEANETFASLIDEMERTAP